MDDEKFELTQIPDYVATPKGVFKDIEHYKNVLACVTRELVAQGASDVSGSFLFDGIQIEFKNIYKAEEIFLDYIRSKIVLRAPLKQRESDKSLLDRRMYYFSHLIKSVEAMKNIGISQIYLSLEPEGQKQISASIRVKKGKR